MNLSDRQSAILKTVSHFDVLDYPLSLSEIINFSQVTLTASDALSSLAEPPLNNIISQLNGLYFLTGQERLLALRHERYRWALQKLNKAKRAARVLNYFPWIRAVAIYSSLSLKNSRELGDIDLFFITAPQRAWSARFFINLILTIFNLRPKPNNTKDKLCTSYFIDSDNLDLSVSNDGEDYYYTYGTGAFTFLAGQSALICEFFQANDWIRRTLPNWQPINSNLRGRDNQFWRDWQNWQETIFGIISEKFYYDRQLELLPPKYQANNDSKRVLLSAGIIKTHDNDKRQKFNQLFETNYQHALTNNYEHEKTA